MKKILYLILVVVVLVLFFCWPFFLKVGIKCQSQYGDCNNEILQGLSSYNQKNLYKAKSGVSKYLKSNYLISDFSLQFKLPNILFVQILVKKPVFALYNSTQSMAALVDPEGKVLSINKDTLLPRVVTNQDLPKSGENVGANNLFALKIIGGVYEMYQINDGFLENDSLTVDLTGPIRVIFPLEGDTEVLLGALKLIYTKTQGENQGRFTQIDLRYKNPVLR